MSTVFTATATAADSAVAEALAAEQARTQAFETFGADTAFVGVDNVRITFNDTGVNSTGTYTAVFTTQAESQPQPPEVPINTPAITPPVPEATPAPVTTDNPGLAAQNQIPVPTGTAAPPVAPGWDGNQDDVTGVDQAVKEQAYADTVESEDAAMGQAMTNQLKSQQAISNQQKNANNQDWRVRLSLAPSATYLYKDANNKLLAPLQNTGGVVFPYTPKIDTSYRANYNSYDLTHSNYRGYFYKNSYVDQVNVSCTFTAQNTAEANYLLAVISFFKSVTKMFYGQDAERGAPPPLVYLTGLGEYQFSKNPCVVTSFQYTLPSDVDYIRSGSVNMGGSTQTSNVLNPKSTGAGLLGMLGPLIPPSITRLASSPLVNLVTGGAGNSALNALGVTTAGVPKGAISNPPSPPTNQTNPTYVPTKIEIQIALLPIQSRSQVSKQFSVKEFANGNLLKGGFW